ncbi:NUDIX domain-containing protein [Microbacterium oleivorans]|uniref:NUDIX domain-containing protein n=1 Tax=Microbacterium oleivorans TaxID=273677 RepID=UPI00203F7313|nr:NUDIX domain-containing protein [Microbacterium oleivorans]MCM3696351.1 NUDIX domain-containing protein [Microbacterium oleivorans]
MIIRPPDPGEPRRPLGPRDPGDAWVLADSGEKYWGRFGAAGLLAHDPARGILLQHRVSWSHFGGTWGIPGGARHEGESATDAAIRESQEEAGVPGDALRPLFTSVLDRDVWTYTTLVATVERPFEPVIADPESYALEWVPVDRVDGMPLHPGFAGSWPALREALSTRVTVIVDAANVVGSTPDGWWKDRAGATERLLSGLSDLSRGGVPAEALGLGGDRWFPRVVAVLEGAARAASDAGEIEVVRAAGEGDDQIVASAVESVHRGDRTLVVTSDRGLTERVREAGATTQPVSWLRGLLTS